MALNEKTFKVDLAFICDCTGSMKNMIYFATNNINKIVDAIKNKACGDLRVAFIAYRDHAPQDESCVTDVSDFSDDIAVAKSNIAKATAMGCGDFPEAVCCGLYDSLYSISWRDDAVKICILIAEAPPHGIGASGDCFPNGCPEHRDPVDLAHKMAEKSITLYCVGCEPSLGPYRQFFIALTFITGGQYFPVMIDQANSADTDAENKRSQCVIGNAIREDIFIEKLLMSGGQIKELDEDALTKRIIHDHLIYPQEINSTEMDIKINENVKEMSKMKTLRDLVRFSNENSIDITSCSAFLLQSNSTFIVGNLEHQLKQLGRGKRKIKASKSKSTAAGPYSVVGGAAAVNPATSLNQASRLAKKLIERNKNKIKHLNV